MSRARFHFQSRLRRSFRAWPHGVAHSWGSASLHPRLLSGAPSALKRRSCKTQTLPPRLSCHKKVTILEGCFSAVAAILNSALDLGERARRTVTPRSFFDARATVTNATLRKRKNTSEKIH